MRLTILAGVVALMAVAAGPAGQGARHPFTMSAEDVPLRGFAAAE